MKPVFAALAVLAFTLPAMSQGNARPNASTAAPAAPVQPAAPPSALSEQALNACPDIMARTDSAVANGHVQYYYMTDCECMGRAIDYNTWNESTVSYDGPKMPDSDAYVIVGALSASPTIEDAFSAIDENISDTGYSAISACFGK